MTKIEAVDGNNWEDFLKSPKAVLLIGKSDCEACNAWTSELSDYLEGGDAPADVRFGKMLVDKPGLVHFKRANPWLAEVEVLPYTVIYANGEKFKEFAGGGIERMNNRLARLSE